MPVQNPGADTAQRPQLWRVEIIHTESPEGLTEHFAAKEIKIASSAPFTGFQSVMSLETSEEEQEP